MPSLDNSLRFQYKISMSSARPVAADYRLTLRLALPLIMAELGWMSMGLVDTLMVGRLPDSAIAIGATGLVSKEALRAGDAAKSNRS